MRTQKSRLKGRDFFLPKTCQWHVFAAGQYVGLPGRMGNANTKKSQAKAWLFFYVQVMLAATVHRTVATPGQYVGLPGKIGNAIREAPNDDTTSLSVHYVIRLVMKCCVLLGIKRTEFCLACTKDTPSIAGGVL